MSEESDGKKPLGRVQLQRKPVPSASLASPAIAHELEDFIWSLAESRAVRSDLRVEPRGDLWLEPRGDLRVALSEDLGEEPAGDQRDEGPVEHVRSNERPTAHPPFDDELSRPLANLPVAAVSLGQLDAGESLLPPAQASHKRVLVVDDSDDIRRLLVRALRERDYDIIESASGQDALEKVRECAPDLLVLDAMLPDVHGFDVCRRVKSSRRYGHIPVIMLSAVYTGWRFAEDLRRSYGVDAFIEKPFRIGEVVLAVERALAGPGRSQPPEDAEVEGLAADQLRAGMEAYASGDTQAAVEHLRRGLTIDPLSFRLHYHLGLLYGKQENVFEAIHELETAADLRPRDFSTLKNLAVLYQRAGFLLKATEMWERALGSAPDDATRTSIRNHVVSLL